MTTAPSSAPRLRAPRHRVSRRAVGFWTVRALLGWLALCAAEVLVLCVGLGPIGRWQYTVLAVTGGIGLIHLAVMPRWRYRVHRWEVTATAVYTQAGWLNQERRVAPISRIQTVDSERGPIEQLFRLANVTVTTASAAGPLKIHGLDLAVATTLVAELAARSGDSAGDAT